MSGRYLSILNEGSDNGGILHGLMPPHDPPTGWCISAWMRSRAR